MTRARAGTRRIAAAQARQTFSRLIGDVRTAEETVIIEKGGVPVAAIVPLGALERMRLDRVERGERLALLERLRSPFREVAPDELERRVGQAISAARSGRKRRRSRTG